LENLNFGSDIRLLRKWQVTSHNLEKHILDIKTVRNQLAHRWDEKEVFYGKDTHGKKITIVNNIGKFKQDAEKVWTDLIDIYMKEEEKQIGRVISKLEDPNTIKKIQ
jgi:predicted hydrolase (HD superfamily)